MFYALFQVITRFLPSPASIVPNGARSTLLGFLIKFSPEKTAFAFLDF
jgi:hypothetical protein